MALYADHNGLASYQTILKNAKKYLNKNGIIAFEIGYQQAEQLTTLAKFHFPTAKITVEKDLQEKDRYLLIEL